MCRFLDTYESVFLLVAVESKILDQLINVFACLGGNFTHDLDVMLACESLTISDIDSTLV